MTKSILLVAMLLGSANALAQPGPPTSSDIQASEKAYAEGRAHYDLREWDQAIAKFKEAYRLRPSDAASLFNIAQSYRLKGDCVEALSFYRTYRRNFPGEKNIDKVDQFIQEMETCAQTRSTEPTQPAGPDPGSTTTPTTTPPTTSPTPTPSTTAPPPIAPAPLPPPRDDHAGRGMKLGGLAVGGVGVALVAVGAVSAVSASSKAGDLEDLPMFDPDLDKEGKRAALRARILLGVGGAAVVTGVVLYVVGSKQAERASSVAVVPHGDGGMVVWSGGF